MRYCLPCALLALCGIALAEPPAEAPPMRITPAPKTVKIDGDLAEWANAGKMGPVTFDDEMKDDYHATCYAMYDADNLYLAAVVVETHLPFNPYPNRGVGAWNADDLIIRMSSNPALPVPIQDPCESMAKNADLFTADFWWNHLKKATYWDGYFGMAGDILTREKLPGVAVAVKGAKDGKGYTIEIKLPWKLINPAFHPKAGDTIALTYEISIANNNPGEPKRAFQIFVNGGGSWAFNNPSLWGKAVFQ